MLSSIPDFTLPDQALAKEPPERRGLARDQVRLLVIERSANRIHHSRFSHLTGFLQPGDLLVFNNSRTLPAVLHGWSSRRKTTVEIRLAERLPDHSWYGLVLCDFRPEPAETFLFANRICATLGSAHPHIPGLWKLIFDVSESDLLNGLYRNGDPIRYEYARRPWELDYYQTIYALQPGSAEMPSAGRAFTWSLLFELKRKGVELASITLHTGLSSYMDDGVDSRHPVSEEEYFISPSAAEKINFAKSRGRRIIAVGTTVVRSLESAALDSHGLLHAVHGYTSLRITAEHQLQTANGLITGLHEPQASHLDLLSAFVPAHWIQSAYEEAIASGYLWHEFGDLNLIL